MRIGNDVRFNTSSFSFVKALKRAVPLIAPLVMCIGVAANAGAAIAFGSSSTATNGGSSNTLVITKPAGVATGDVLVAQITFEKGSDINPLTPPAGWTLELRTNNGTDIGQATFFKVITNAGTEPASYTWTFSQTAKAAGAILRYSGVDATDPTVASAGSSGASGDPVAPTVNANAGSVLLGLFGVKKQTTFTVPGGMTQRAYATNTGNDISILAADEPRASAGLTGTRTANAATEDKWVAQSVTLRVGAVANQPPVNVVPGAQAATEDVALTFSSGNGNQVSTTDPDAGASNVEVTLSVTDGTLTLNGTTGLSFSVGDGTGDTTMTFTGTLTSINTALNGLVYTPTPNFNGAATLTITTNDLGNTGTGGAMSDTDNVTINVAPANDNPDAVDDTATVDEDSGANAVNVLANDTIAPDAGETLTVTGVTQGANGAVAITGGGTGLTYTPDADFFGSDSFTYTIDDGNGGTDTATVSVTVTNVNDNPDAVDDTATVDEDSGANAVNVLANDTFAPDAGETLTITGVTQGANGSVAITGGGTGVTYTPDADFFGSDSFTYTIDDGNGGTDTATVSVTVTNVNDNPDAVDDTATVDEDSGANAVNVLANDTIAPDAGETLTITGVTQGANGSVAITGGGTGLTYTPDADFFGSDSFTYTIDDGNGGTDTATVSVTVMNVNDNPDAVDDTATVDEDSGANAVNVLANDTIAPDAGETLTITGVTQGANGSVAITGGGTGVTYTPDADFFGSDSFTYSIDDGNGGTDTATVSVTVTNTNDNPDAVDDSPTVGEDSGANAINVLANDTALPDVGETLTITAVTQGSDGSVAITGGGTGLTYTPNADFFGSDSFTYTIEDGNGGTDTATVSVTVTNANDNPDAVDDSTSVPEDSGANAIDVLANDTALPDAGETLTITGVTQGADGAVAITGGGTGLTYTPSPGFVGSDSFTYTISDGNGGTDTATVSVTVTNENDNPVAGDDSATVGEDSGANAIDVLANDTALPDVGESLIISGVTQGTNGSVAITGGGSGLSYTPDADFFGADSFTYTISDGNGGSDTATVSISVTNANDNPNAIDDNAILAEDSGTNAIDVLANDTTVPDAGETLTITGVTQGTSGAVAITGGGTGVTYTPNPNFAGIDSFTYTVSDGNGGVDTATVSVTVINANDNPDAVNDATTVIEDSAANAIDVLANDTTAPDAGESLTIIAVTQGTNGSVAITGGGSGLTYTPDANFFGSDTFTYTVSDGNGGADTATVTVTVNNTNDDPDAVDDAYPVPEDSGTNTVNVLANDTAAPDAGETLTITGVTQGANGSVAITGGGTGLTYTPNPSFAGGDSFTYTISDGNGGSDTATVTITVTNANDNPNAVDDAATVAEDSSANAINVLANDTAAPDIGETLTITGVSQGTNGSVAITGGGTGLTYTPSPNFFGSDSFTYTIADGNGGADTATVAVTVTNTNDNPDAVDDAATVIEDSGANAINVLANDTAAPDSGETLTITAVTQGANGSVAITGAGTGLTYTPSPNFSGSDSFTYTISDGNGGVDTATVSVTITDDDAPTADLTLTKVVNGTGPFVVGSNATFTLTVTNAGPGTATNVHVLDTLPAGTSFVSATATAGTCSGTTTVDCNIGTLENGSSSTITLTVQLNAAGNISNTATATANTVDLTPASATANVTVAESSHHEDIPTASEWMLLALATALAAAAALRLRA